MSRPDKISGADIAAICQEAGMLAVRQNRYVILPKDFEKAYKNVITKEGAFADDACTGFASDSHPPPPNTPTQTTSTASTARGAGAAAVVVVKFNHGICVHN